jgi:hypothetical protein
MIYIYIKHGFPKLVPATKELQNPEKPCPTNMVVASPVHHSTINSNYIQRDLALMFFSYVMFWSSYLMHADSLWGVQV